jgi:peroxiredoxin
MELAGLASRYADIEARGAELLVVTTDPPAVASRAALELRLPFAILSADADTLRRWGVLDERADIARPASIVIDEDGRVRDAWFPDSQRTGVAPERLLDSL